MKRRAFLTVLAAAPLGISRARGSGGPWGFWTRASAYGPGSYGPGAVTASGAAFGPELVTIAHRWLPLGATVAVEIPPQPDAWGEGLRETGALIWCRVLDRGPYVPDDPGREVDLAMGLLRAAGWFDREITAEVGLRSEYVEAHRWGVRWVKVHVFG